MDGSYIKLSELDESAPLTRYVVAYYDAKMSRKGEGVQRRAFETREEAEAFAAGKRCWAKPSFVQEIHQTFDRAGKPVWVTVPR